MNILFWDIDGTLLKTGKAGLHAFVEATESLFGRMADLHTIQTAGMTDCYIAAQIINQLTGREATQAEIMALISRYEELLPSHLAARRGQLMPAVLDTLAYFHNRTDYVSLLLTGNTLTGAKAKLSSYGIDHYFNFAASGFGNNCHNRLDLAFDALTAAKRHLSSNISSIFVIGDTPNDIRCGKAINAFTIAVATGNYSLEELSRHAPWWALPHLPPPEELERRLSTVP